MKKVNLTKEERLTRNELLVDDIVKRVEQAVEANEKGTLTQEQRELLRMFGHKEVKKPRKDTSHLKNWYHINVGLWQHDVHVFIGSRQDMVTTMPDALTDYGYNYDRMRKVCDGFLEDHPRFLSEPDNGGDSLGSASSNDVFVRLNTFSYEVSDLLIAMHECLHAANGILINVGLQDNGNKEGLAYTQEFIYGSFLRQYIERNTPENHKKG